MDRPEPGSRKGRIARLTLGWAMTIVGLILGPVPILPGFVFLLPGLALLAAESRTIRGWLRRVRQKRLVKSAMREAERVGIRIDLGHDDEEEPPSGARPDRPPRDGGKDTSV